MSHVPVVEIDVIVDYNQRPRHVYDFNALCLLSDQRHALLLNKLENAVLGRTFLQWVGGRKCFNGENNFIVPSASDVSY